MAFGKRLFGFTKFVAVIFARSFVAVIRLSACCTQEPQLKKTVLGAVFFGEFNDWSPRNDVGVNHWSVSEGIYCRRLKKEVRLKAARFASLLLKRQTLFFGIWLLWNHLGRVIVMTNGEVAITQRFLGLLWVGDITEGSAYLENSRKLNAVFETFGVDFEAVTDGSCPVVMYPDPAPVSNLGFSLIASKGMSAQSDTPIWKPLRGLSCGF